MARKWCGRLIGYRTKEEQEQEDKEIAEEKRLERRNNCLVVLTVVGLLVLTVAGCSMGGVWALAVQWGMCILALGFCLTGLLLSIP